MAAGHVKYDGAARRKLVVVTGKPGEGKSHFIEWQIRKWIDEGEAYFGVVIGGTQAAGLEWLVKENFCLMGYSIENLHKFQKFVQSTKSAKYPEGG